MKFLNFDANASYGLLPEVEEQLRQILARLGAGAVLNPSSIHAGGQQAKLILDDARDAVRELVGASADSEVVFTSGATEGNNWILNAPFLHGVASTEGAAVVATAIEHHSILEPIEQLRRRGIKAALLTPGTDGSWNSAPLEAVCSPASMIFSCMAANNETGELLPVAELTARARAISQEIFVHCDAVQAAGKIPISFENLKVDALSVSAHKLGGLTGAGAVVLTDERELASLILGGPQESRHRAGTENVLGIASLGIAARIAVRDFNSRTAAMKRNSDDAARILLAEVSGARVLRSEVSRIPNTILAHIPGVRADDLVVACDLQGVGISSGAACASGKQLPSHVLLGLGYPVEVARECVRISFRGEESAAEVALGMGRIVSAALQLRRADGMRANPA